MTASAFAGLSLAWNVISSAKDTPRKLMSEPSLLFGSNLPPPLASAVTSLPEASVITNCVLLVKDSVYGCPLRKLASNAGPELTRP
ncbi:hypothetical protein D9M71_487260 [compost metagenome]